MSSIPDYASEIETSLRAFASPERAVQEKRYLKSDLEHLGITVPQTDRIAKDFLKTHGDLDRAALLELVRELWSVPIHERRAAAITLLDLRVKELIPADLDLIETLIRASRGWAFVDNLSGSITGKLLVQHPEAVPRVDPWANDPDFGVRRSALLSCLATHKVGWPLDRFFGYADPMMEEKEFFIRKAIGWVLREAGKKRPEEVFAWLRPRIPRASAVTVREAVKHLSPDQRDELLAAYKQR